MSNKEGKIKRVISLLANLPSDTREFNLEESRKPLSIRLGLEPKKLVGTLRDKVLAECKAWANTDADFDAGTPPKRHPSGWEIWEVEDYYEFHRGEIGGDNEWDFYEYFPHSEIIEDRCDVVAEMLGIKMEDIQP